MTRYSDLAELDSTRHDDVLMTTPSGTGTSIIEDRQTIIDEVLERR